MEDKQTGNDWQKIALDAACEPSGFEEAPLEATISNLAMITILTGPCPEHARNPDIISLVKRAIIIGMAIKDVRLGELVRQSYRIEV